MSCLAPPPVPQFGLRDDNGTALRQNYRSDWFQLDFVNNSDGSVNHTHYRVSRTERALLYQPGVPYQPTELKEFNLVFIARNRSERFNAVYEIKLNASTAVYTCPRGWVFNNSNNISHTATCLHWNWVVDFNTSMPCVREFGNDRTTVTFLPSCVL